MQTLGNGFIPSANHAGGLRYHGMNSVLSKLYRDGLLEARAEIQTEVFDAAVKFMKVEGILPAPESSHAIKAAIDEALACKKTGEKKVILFGLTGTGYFDLSAYMSYNAGTLTDRVPTDGELEKGFATIPDIPQNS
jgi:tryptophan synthase beta chain